MGEDTKSVVVVGQPVEIVWEFLYAPENAPLYDKDVLSGARGPGSPLGVGEVQVLRLRPAQPGEVRSPLKLTITSSSRRTAPSST